MTHEGLTVHVGDCIEAMRAMPDEHVHCVVTSPPYYALRDYGIAGQHGLEADFDCLGWATGKPCGACYLCVQLAVFDEVWRVLRNDGTCWVNLGDSTASSGGRGMTRGEGNTGRKGRTRMQENPRPGLVRALRPKSKMLIPYRFALAMQARGWIVRQDIIWHKRSPMPETAKDRPTNAHEYLFLLAKQRFYYYDHLAIAEPTSPNTHARYARATPSKGRRGQMQESPEIHPDISRKGYLVPSGWDTGSNRGERALEGRYGTGVGWGYAEGEERVSSLKPRVKNNPSTDQALANMDRAVRNKRSVWTLSSEPFKGAHFATFPTKLVEPCILAGCPKGGIVLDPYGGSGTVGGVALAHHRRAVLCELNPEYAALVPRRVNEILGAARAKSIAKRIRRRKSVVAQSELFDA